MNRFKTTLTAALVTLCAQGALASDGKLTHTEVVLDGGCSKTSCNNFMGAPRGFENNTHEPKKRSVNEILKKAKDGELVLVRGHLSKFLGDEKYQFTDRSNDSITVILDDDRDWSYLAKDMPIEIMAKVDRDKVSTVLKVKAARPESAKNE